MTTSVPRATCARCGTTNAGEVRFCQRCGVFMGDEGATAVRVTYTRRFFGDSLLEAVLFIITLVVGWFIWLWFTSATGQTPAKRILNVYVIDTNTERAVSRGQVWLREIVVKFIAFGVADVLLFNLPGLVDAIIVFFNKDRQALHDIMLSQVVVYAPGGLPDGMVYAGGVPAYAPPPIAPAAPMTAAPASIEDQLRNPADARRTPDHGRGVRTEAPGAHREAIARC